MLIAHLSATNCLCLPHQLEIPEERTRALFTLITFMPLHRLQQQHIDMSPTDMHTEHCHLALAKQDSSIA